MAQIQKLIQENQKLRYQLEKFKGSNGLLPYIDDSLFKGGYRVVKTVTDRDNIDCCHSKQGMIVCVIGEDLSFKEYRLISDCKNKQWEEIQTQVTENDVILVEDYSELSETLTTQKELNLVLKQLILNLQTQIDNIELTDEKVQITENTGFAQVGENQKIFNKNVSIYKNNNDLKNQEQDNRLDLIEQQNLQQVTYDIPTIYGSNVFAQIIKFGKQVTFNFNHYVTSSQFTTSGNGSPFILCTLPSELIHNIVGDEIRISFLSYSGLHLARLLKYSGQVWLYPQNNIVGTNATGDSQYNLNITYQVN